MITDYKTLPTKKELKALRKANKAKAAADKAKRVEVEAKAVAAAKANKEYNDRRHVELAESKGLIYNKAGEVVYLCTNRPAKAEKCTTNIVGGVKKVRSGHVNDYVKPAYAVGNKVDCAKAGVLKVEINKTESNDFSPVKKLPEVEHTYKGETKQGCDSRHYQHANYVDTAKKQPTINGRIFGEKVAVQRTDIKNQSAKDEAIAATKAAKAAKGNS